MYLHAESTEPTFRGGVRIRGEHRSTNKENCTGYRGANELLRITKLWLRSSLSPILDVAHPEALIEIRGQPTSIWTWTNRIASFIRLTVVGSQSVALAPSLNQAYSPDLAEARLILQRTSQNLVERSDSTNYRNEPVCINSDMTRGINGLIS